MRGSSMRALSTAELEDLRGWEKLEPQEQTAVRAEYRAIADALHSEGEIAISCRATSGGRARDLGTETDV